MSDPQPTPALRPVQVSLIPSGNLDKPLVSVMVAPESGVFEQNEQDSLEVILRETGLICADAGYIHEREGTFRIPTTNSRGAGCYLFIKCKPGSSLEEIQAICGQIKDALEAELPAGGFTTQ